MGDAAEAEADEPEGAEDSNGTLDAVRILTVHAAKGLEAPFVVLLDANHSEPAADRAGILIDWPPSAAAPVHFSAYGKRSERGLARAARFDDQAALAERENWNLLYVAMTRARQGLIVSGIQRNGKGGGDGESGSEIAGSWYVRLQVADVGEPVPPLPDDYVGVRGVASASAEGPIRFTDFRARYRDAQPVAPIESFGAEEEGEESDDEIVFDAAAARYGELVHALLERITRYPGAYDGVPDAEAVMRWFPLAGAGSPQARTEWREQAEAAVHAVRTMLNAPALRPLLLAEGALSARNEVELYGAQGRLLRIDRLVEYADRVVVVDYKLRLLPQEHAAYAAQLRRYEAALRPMFPGRRIESGIATADGEWIALGQLSAPPPPRQASLF
jgi:ATP-dependent helicase/nuclease subunit A